MADVKNTQSVMNRLNRIKPTTNFLFNAFFLIFAIVCFSPILIIFLISITDVEVIAKEGYKFRSATAKKAGPAVKTFNCAGVELIYEDGDTWAKVIERNPGKIYDDDGWIGRSDTNFFLIEGEVLNNGNQIITTDKIVDPTATYSWQAG